MKNVRKVAQMSVQKTLIILVFLLLAEFAYSYGSTSDLDLAPPPFNYENTSVVPIDIEEITLDVVFDVEKSAAFNQATVKFFSKYAGFPIIDLVPDATHVNLNGKELPQASYQVVIPPGKATKFRVVKENVLAESTNVLKISYKLEHSEISYGSGVVRAGLFMSDLDDYGRGYWEQYGPANFEYDHVKQQVNINIINTSIEHHLFTNGTIESRGVNKWKLRFPEFYTASSFYIHISPKDRFSFVTGRYDGMLATIPITVYSNSSSLSQQGYYAAKSTLKDYEEKFGYYPHGSLLIYVTSSGGGMEYAGATMTSLNALGHEILHSWFGRGIMPANGNAGWLDEAIASWSDEGYQQSNPSPRDPVNLGGYSPYRRHTPYAAYIQGERLMREFNYMFSKTGGLIPLLKDLFTLKRYNVITTEMFQKFLEEKTNTDLTSTFKRYVYGLDKKSQDELATSPSNYLNEEPFDDVSEVSEASKSDFPAPNRPFIRPYTKEELSKYH